MTSASKNEIKTLRDKFMGIAMLSTEINIPFNMNYKEAELIREVIDSVSHNYTRENREILEIVKYRLNDQMYQSLNKIINQPYSIIPDKSVQENPDFLEIL
jgi:hypothetical protein